MSEANKYDFWMLIGYIAPGSTSAASAGQTTNFDYTAVAPTFNKIGQYYRLILKIERQGISPAFCHINSNYCSSVNNSKIYRLSIYPSFLQQILPLFLSV